MRRSSRNGYNIVESVSGDLNYRAVSDLNAEELEEFRFADATEDREITTQIPRWNTSAESPHPSGRQSPHHSTEGACDSAAAEHGNVNGPQIVCGNKARSYRVSFRA